MNVQLQRVLRGLTFLAVMMLSGCAGLGPSIDSTTYRAVMQDSRVQFLIIHYTAEPLNSSIHILTQQQVSSHYLLTDEAKPRIYRLVDESMRAAHAGVSSWGPQTLLNASSIGIEIVNAGGRKNADGNYDFAPYSNAQIETLIPLIKDIVKRHQIRPDRILGHSDIAPQRKIDPGPLFPWKRLADEGLIPWPDAQKVAAAQLRHEARLPSVAWFQKALATHGFQIPQNGQLDEPTQRVILVFQMKYRPQRYDGQPDAHTAAILSALTGIEDEPPK